MSNDWPPQVNREYAEKDGLAPADFDISKWPVANVRIEAGGPSVAAVYRCDMPPGTPHMNVYVKDDSDPTGYRMLPDPVGMVLSRVEFQLVDVLSGVVLDTDGRDHEHGKVTGFLNDGGPHGSGPWFWSYLEPGIGIEVKLRATPMFCYLSVDGSMHAEYANANDGYFAGVTSESGLHTMALAEDGAFLLDGKAVE